MTRRLTHLAFFLAPLPAALCGAALAWTLAGPSSAAQPTRLADTAYRFALASAYEKLAAEMAAYDGQPRSNWADAQYFALKAMAAGRGETAEPEKLDDWTIEAHDREELEDARDRLVFAMARTGYRATPLAPAALDWLAEAQARFDCWVERAEDGADLDACRLPFERALIAVEAAIALNERATALSKS